MQRGVVQNTSELQQDSPIGDFNWATNFPGGEGDCSHSGHHEGKQDRLTSPGLSLNIA